MRLRTMVFFMFLSSQAAVGAGTIRLAALPSTLRAGQEGIVDGTDAAEISGARGEFESFQIVVTASGGNLQDISAGMSSLKKETGETLPAKSVSIYNEVFISVRYSAPGATVPPGLTSRTASAISRGRTSSRRARFSASSRCPQAAGT